jgi:hypothetical protein
VYLGFECEDENGEHVEVIDRVPCRRCRAEKGANVRLRTARSVAATFGVRPQELGRPVHQGR